MALGIVFLIIFCMCCFSSILAAVWVYPPPSNSTSPYDGFNQVATGRAFYQRGTDMSFSSPPDICAKNCELDSTCTGFNTWQNGSGIFATQVCLKQTSNASPWSALPAYLIGKTNSNIFVKSS